MKNKNKKAKNSPKREKQTRYLSQAIQLEESVNPHIIRATMSLVSMALLAFVVWAGLTNINEVARTPGEVVPQGYQQSVQHLEGGIVNTINVKDGEIVEEGDILLTLSDASIKKDLERAEIKQLDLEMQAERLRAFINGEEPDFTRFKTASDSMIIDQQLFFDGMRSAREKEQNIIRNQLEERKQSIVSLQNDMDTLKENLKIAQTIYYKRVDLNKKGYASDMQLLEDRKQLNKIKGEVNRLNNQTLVSRTEIQEYEERLSSLGASHLDEALEQLSLVSSEKAQNREIIDKLKERIGRLHVRAPTAGLIQGVKVNTIGAVVQSGQTIMDIVPFNKNLEVAVKISPQDIGHLQIGQPVQVKFSTFDFSRYGSVKGKLDHISATTFSADNGERYYHGRVLLDQNYVGANPQNVIMPGMTVMADVITGRKTILQYMLKPIHISLKTAFTER